MIYLFFILLILPIISFSHGFFLESKHFASVYAINENSIIPYGFGTNTTNIIKLPHKVGCADTLLKEHSESIIYATKENPNTLYNVDIQKNIIAELIIPHNEKIPLFVHAISTKEHLIFLALSSDPTNFDTPESRISCFVIQSSKDQESKLIPLLQDISLTYIKEISNEETAKVLLKKMYFDNKTQRLFCCFDFIKEGNDEDSYYYYDYIVSFLEKDEEKSAIAWIVETGQQIGKKNQQLIDSTLLQTSTALSYMIFASEQKSGYEVCAMGITPKGSIVNKKNNCDNLFFAEALKRFTGRCFIKEEKKSFELEDRESYSFLVGNNNFPGDVAVKKLKILGDTVCIITKNTVFGSTAIFDREGRIKGWTNWKKIIEQESEIDDIHIDRFTGEYLIFTENKIEKSAWRTFSYDNFDTPFRAVFLSEINNNNSEIQLYALDAHSFFHLKINRTNNTLEKNICATIDSIGELISLHHYYDEKTEKNCFLVSGTEGMVQLIFKDQETIETVEKISDLGRIKKIIIDQKIIYFLSSSCLYRANLHPDKSMQENIARAELLIDTKKRPDFVFLTDIIISDACVLLATGSGIWLLKEGSIRKGIPQFAYAHFPERIGIPASFFVQSVTGKESDFARHCGGNIFVLFSDVAADQSKLYRLSVEPTCDSKIQFDTVSFFNDVILRNQPTSFLNFSSAQSCFFTDGIRYLLPSTGKQTSLFPQPTLGIVWSGNKLQTLFDHEWNSKHILYTGIHELSGNLLISTAHELYVHA